MHDGARRCALATAWLTLGCALATACSTVRLEGEGGAGSSTDAATSVTLGAMSASTTGAGPITAQASTTAASTVSSSSTGLRAPRLPSCLPNTIDDFEDPAHTAITWEYATIEDGTLLVDDQGVYPADRDPRPFEDCFLALRVVEVFGSGTLHCHLDPDLDPDHDSVSISSSGDETRFDVTDGTGQDHGFRSDPVALGWRMAAVFEGGRIRVLGAPVDAASWTLVMDAQRPAFLDVAFSPCVFGLGAGDSFRVDDVNVVPPALYDLGATL